jgi:hypothetical protein
MISLHMVVGRVDGIAAHPTWHNAWRMVDGFPVHAFNDHTNKKKRRQQAPFLLLSMTRQA